MTKHDRRRAPPKEQFPVKLYALLEMADVPGLGCAGGASWLPHGRAFKVLDEERFMASVPMFFKATKIRSLYRQLNLWGFKRASRGRDRGAWHHDAFLRGRPEEMKRMIRIKIKGAAAAGSGCHRGDDEDSKDPDFYAMPPLLPSASAHVASSGPPPVVGGHKPRRVSLEMLESSPSSSFESGAPCFPSAEELRFRHVRRSSVCHYQREAFEPPAPSSMPPSYNNMSMSSQVSRSMSASSSIPSSATSSPVPSRAENVEDLKRWLTADLEPLPYCGEGQGAFDRVPTFPSPVERAAEPLPFDDDGGFRHEERDDFANYIDNVIQLM
ncbi:hypothetical protein ACHAWF_013004 [Thalassiosira exigua]